MASSPLVDAALPALETALDPQEIASMIGKEPALGWVGPPSIEILSYKPGLRCTIRYRAPERNGSERSVIGKLYRSKRRAARMFARQLTLAPSFPVENDIRLPGAVLFVEELGLVLQEQVEGTDLRDTVLPGADVTPVVVAGRWLARLHASEAPPEVKIMSAAGRLERMRGWASETTPHLEESLARRLDGAIAEQETRFAREQEPLRRVIHKDFYYANLLWDGRRIWGLDLDEVSLGDTAFDLGHFLAHLVRHAWRSGFGEEGAARSCEAFASSYRGEERTPLPPRTAFYKAYTFVKLAATEVVRKNEGWIEAARVLSNLGVRELES